MTAMVAGQRDRRLVESSLVTVRTAEDRELARLLIEIETSRRILRDLESERAELETSLTEFAALVRARVGALKDEIKDIRTRLDEVRQRMERLKADPTANPDDVERDLAEELAAQASMNGDPGVNGSNHSAPGFSGEKRRRISLQRETLILQLYRDLAKRYHPDLAQLPEERQRREELMLRVNIAYRDRDLAALQSLLLETEANMPSSTDRLMQQRLSWARHEAARLGREIVLNRSRIGNLRSSETYSLMIAQVERDQILDDLEQRTKQRLQRERDRLDEANAQYARMSIRRQIIQRRAASSTGRASASVRAQ
jgi:exonuclease VII small subunit